MLLVDANVLLYAVNEDAPRHVQTRTWLSEHLVGRDPVGFAWIALLAFIRVSTLPGLSPRPLAVEDALDIVADWLAAPASTTVQPTARHPTILRGLLLEAGTAGNLTGDAHLAALAIEHGATVCTYDRDFERFPGVRCLMPGA
ncbi:type II toxin-antitoxin system VapC family toxin [soil metagenome]